MPWDTEPTRRPRSRELSLELPDLGDVGGHFHDHSDFAVRIPDGSRRDEGIDRASVAGYHQLLAFVCLAVLKSARHGTIQAGLPAVLVNLVAVGPDVVAKIFLKAPVALDDAQLSVLHRDIARDFLEEEPVALPVLPEFLFQDLHRRDVGRDFHHRLDASVRGQNRGGVDENRHLLAVGQGHHLASGVGLSVRESGLDWAIRTGLLPLLIDLITPAADGGSEDRGKILVGGQDVPLSVMDRHEAGGTVEKSLKGRGQFGGWVFTGHETSYPVPP